MSHEEAKSRHETLESAVSDSVAPHLLALQSGTKNKRSRKVNQPAKNVNEKEDTQIEFPTPPAKLLKRAITKNTTPPCMPTVFPAQKSLSLNRKETAKSPPQLPEKTPASFSETTGDQGFSNWYYFMCPIDYNQSFSLPAVIETGQEIQPGCSGFVAPKSIAVFKNCISHYIVHNSITLLITFKRDENGEFTGSSCWFIEKTRFRPTFKSE